MLARRGHSSTFSNNRDGIRRGDFQQFFSKTFQYQIAEIASKSVNRKVEKEDVDRISRVHQCVGRQKYCVSIIMSNNLIGKDRKA